MAVNKNSHSDRSGMVLSEDGVNYDSPKTYSHTHTVAVLTVLANLGGRMHQCLL